MLLGFGLAEHDMTCLRDRHKRDVIAAERAQPPAIFDRHDLVLLAVEDQDGQLADREVGAELIPHQKRRWKHPAAVGRDIDRR
jgi:hypothetical protein